MNLELLNTILLVYLCVVETLFYYKTFTAKKKPRALSKKQKAKLFRIVSNQ